ncbi:MAG: right-handed parallel beta-helix repeat-containing protein, partial [Candidatus Thermoplasmatota archaeon]|nr:right-handed parallel beta-helix repeat-containing protein [Candidatus Thermoplasmatota archaeon]
MRYKIVAFTLCLLLLLSGLLVVAQGLERDDREKVVTEDKIDEDRSVKENVEETIPERELIHDSYEPNFEDVSIDERWGRTNERVNLEGEIENKQAHQPYNHFHSESTLTGEISREDQNSVPWNDPNLAEDYEEREPIRINNNTDFADKASEENWSGNGTLEDPYIIEEYEIDGSGPGYSIYIGNVTDHFEVSECHLHNTSGGQGEYSMNSGVHLFNTSNGHISDNFLSNNTFMGIHLEHSHNNTISNNTAYSNEGHQILLEDSDENKVINNDIYGENLSLNRSSSHEDIEYSKDSVLVQVESPDKDMIRSMGQERALKLQTDHIADAVKGSTSRTYPAFDMAEISLNDGMDVKSAVEFLTSRDEVITAEPNYLMDFQKTPNDPGYDSLWGMPMIDTPSAWDITTGSEEVVVAVIDTGIDYNHPDLKDNMWTSEEGYHGYNAVNDSYDPMDDLGHGTHVAGTIGAVGDNGLGVVGVNWNVSLMGVKIGDAGGLTIGNAIAGLEYVLEKKKEGENIVATSNSWGGGVESELLYEAIEQHQKEDISFVAAAGNAGTDTDQNPFYPANYDLTNIISVAATDQNDELAYFSNYGRRSVHVGAPGVDINSTIPGGEYVHARGTSMAAPHVSGLVALLASHNSSYDHNQLKNAILSSADQPEDLQNRTLTDGRINAYQALELSPDPDNIRFWVHRPTLEAEWREETPISISLNDGVNPIIEANVTVDFSTRDDTVYLEDDGSQGDQIDDGYYTGKWVPQNLGEIDLTITAVLDGEWELTKNITTEVQGDSGIALVDSKSNSLSNNEINDNYYGISLYSSESNEFMNSTVLNNTHTGVRLYKSRDNEMIDHTISNNRNGILLEESDGNSVSYANISDNSIGVILQFSDNNTFSNNNLSNNNAGLIIENSIENQVIENEISNQRFYNLVLFQSTSNRIVNNNLSNQFFGLLIQNSNENRVKENKISNNLYGMALFQSDNNRVLKNNVSNNDLGIFHLEASYNKLEENNISNNMIGIYIGNSKNVELVGNIMIDGSIYMEGTSLEHWTTHSIDTSNTVNGDPVYYWKNESGGTVPQNAGQIILANCDEVEVKEQEISGGSVGILLGFSSNNKLMENSVTNSNWEGITLFESDGNLLENNLASENEFPGVFMFQSDDNILANNTASDNNYGIITFGSRNNTFNQNTVSSNQREGITLSESDENVLKSNAASENGYPGFYLYESNSNKFTNNTGSNNDYGVLIYRSDNNEFINNTVSSNNVEGITIRESNGNILKNNIASENEYPGIFLLNSDDNNFIKNTVGQNDFGFYLGLSNNNTFTKNTILDNGEVGIYIEDSRENLIFRNKIIENENQAWDNGDNEWDAGDPAKGGEGGNYWSDYDGKDRGDGVGDKPYNIEGDENRDNYPWMNQEMMKQYELTINLEGEGIVEVDGEKLDSEKGYTYKEGTEVELEATGDKGWKFEEWTGDYESIEENITITIEDDVELTANFQEEDKDILDRIRNIIDLPDLPNRPDGREIPGFSFFLLILGAVL